MVKPLTSGKSSVIMFRVQADWMVDLDTQCPVLDGKYAELVHESHCSRSIYMNMR